mgnify:CR=1 FL=1
MGKRHSNLPNMVSASQVSQIQDHNYNFISRNFFDHVECPVSGKLENEQGQKKLKLSRNFDVSGNFECCPEL